MELRVSVMNFWIHGRAWWRQRAEPLKRSSIRRVAYLILIILAAVNAQAQGNTSNETAPVSQPEGMLPIPEYGGDIWTRSYLTGDWGGKRAELADNGIQFDIEFLQYSQSVVEGGRDSETAWGGKGSYMLHLDLQKMNVMPGAMVYVRFDSRWGRGSLGRTGQLLPANQSSLIPVDYADPFVETWGTLTAFTYTQFLSENFGIFFGQLDNMDADFSEFAGGRGDTQFMNYNFIYAAPTAIVPASALGTGIMFIPNENVTIASQVFSATDSTFTSGFGDLDEGFISATALMTQYRLGELPGGFNASYLHWFDKEFTNIDSFFFIPGEGIASTTEDSSWLVALSAWQYLYTEEPSEGPLNIMNKKPDLQGWGLFGRIGLADKDTNPMHNNYSIGIGARGLLPERDNDVCGIGYFYTDVDPDRFLSGPLDIKGSLQGIESFYSIAITPATKLTFDVQWLESVKKSIDDAIVLGARFQLIF